MEALENKNSNYNSIFKGILKQHINKRRKEKENRRKSNERKRKRNGNNVQRYFKAERRFVINLYPVYYVCSITIFYLYINNERSRRSKKQLTFVRGLSEGT